MMKRILMLNNEFPPLGGGMGTANLALLRCLASQELEIDVITAAVDGWKEVEHLTSRIRIFKVPVWNRNIHHSSNRELLTYAALGLPLALKNHRSRPYHFCFAWSTLPAGVMALALHRLAGLPYLVRVTGPDIPGFEKRYEWMYPFISPVIRAAWQGAVTVVAKCQGEAEMIKAAAPGVPVRRVANGVDLSAFIPGPPIPDDGPLHLLCVGRLIERKGQSQLFQAMQRLTLEGFSLELELVGTGDSREAYEAQVRELGLCDRVIFAGYVPREEIARRYAAAHVFVLASFNEGMSVATLEAMASGLPLVITRTGGAVELVDEGVNGFTFAWGDVDTLTAHLRRLALDRALARRLGAASRARAASFSWEAMAESYLKLFSECCSLRFNKLSGLVQDSSRDSF